MGITRYRIQLNWTADAFLLIFKYSSNTISKNYPNYPNSRYWVPELSIRDRKRKEFLVYSGWIPDKDGVSIQPCSVYTPLISIPFISSFFLLVGEPTLLQLWSPAIASNFIPSHTNLEIKRRITAQTESSIVFLCGILYCNQLFCNDELNPDLSNLDEGYMRKSI